MRNVASFHEAAKENSAKQSALWLWACEAEAEQAARQVKQERHDEGASEVKPRSRSR